MMSAAFPLLTALCAPYSAREFLDRYWPARVFAAHGPAQRLPALLRDPALASAPDLARRYTSGRLRFTHGASERMVQLNEANPATLLDMGLTVQFVDIARVLPSADAFLAGLTTELGLHDGAVSMSAFVSPPHEGLRCHFDTAELISIQLAGSKRFHHAPVTELPAPIGVQYAPQATPADEWFPQAGAGFPDPATAHFESTLMEPGSVLFLPRGTWHHTEASEPSLSVSIMIDPPTALGCLLDQLRLLLMQDPRWRAPLVGCAGEGVQTAAATATARALLDSLPGAIARLAPEDLTAAAASVGWRLAHLTPATRFQRTPHSRMTVAPAGPNGLHSIEFLVGHTPSLTRSQGHVEASVHTLEIVRWIEGRTHGPFSLAELLAAFPEFGLDLARQLLELCVRTQFLRVLWFPPLAPADTGGTSTAA